MEEIRIIKDYKMFGLTNMYVGKLFGKLTVVSIIGIKKRRTVVKALCECANIKEFFLYNLLRGHTKSCGCSSLIGLTRGRIKHGEAVRGQDVVEYRSWVSMKTRVLSRSDKVREKYKKLDKFGISICCRWLDKKSGYQNFLEDMGRKPSKNHKLTRINRLEGFNGDNCEWVAGGSMSGNEVA
jgi:hypothetical protein